MLSPAGHAAWTGLICAALWRARARGTWAIVPLAFVVAVALHALWDSVASTYWMVPVAVVSYGLLAWRLQAVSARRRPQPTAARPLSSSRWAR